MFFVQNTEEVQRLLQRAQENHISITAQGAKTGRVGATEPLPGAWVIDFSRMKQILEINPTNLIARVQPGVILEDFKQAVEALGLFYPPDPNSLKSCTLGGNVATNAAGPSSLKYGCTRDYILGLEVVLADGRKMRLGKQTVKGVAGYDLVSLVCGSEGTLALITEITLKLLPKPKNLLTALLRFDSNTQALEAVNQILAFGILPRAIEYMDSVCLEGQAAILLELDGGEDPTFLESFGSVQVALSESQRTKLWKLRRLMSEKLKKQAPFKVSEDIVVPRSRLLEFGTELEKLGQRYEIPTACFGHAGDGNLHAQLLFSQVPEASFLDDILHELFALTLRLNGTISGEHGIGLAKKKYLPLEQSFEVIALQKAIKKVWDPQNILNPDKIFD